MSQSASTQPETRSSILSPHTLSAADALAQQVAVCEETHTLLLEENRILRLEKREPPESFLRRKRAQLPRLEGAVVALRTARERDPLAGERLGEEVRKAQKRLLQTIILDKENEQLLLRLREEQALGQPPNPGAARGLYAACARVVERHASAPVSRQA